MQDLLETLEAFLEAGVNEIIDDQPRNLLEEKTPVIEKTAPIKSILAPANFNVKEIKENLVEELKPVNNVVGESREAADKANSLDELKETIENFKGCNLYKTAKNTVFSDGNRESDIVLIGEAPGASEDEQGIPFCGISGKLLDDIFRAIGKKREKNLYITNSVFWRPPGNRRPTDEEIAICRPFVEKHIALKKPKLLVLIGSTAMASILPDVTETISKCRGRMFKYKNQYLENEIDVAPIFHPSYLLRQPAKKKIMWDDMVKIKNYLSK